MAFPSVAGTPTGTADTTSTSFTVSLPASISAGELLLIFMAHDENGTSSTITQSSGSTFTQIANNNNGTVVRGQIWARIATGGESNPVFSSTNNQDVACVALRVSSHGVSNVSTDITISSSSTGSSDAPDPGNCNPGTAKDYLWIAAAFCDDDDEFSSGWQPGSYTAQLQQESAQSTSSCMVQVASRQLNASSEDTGPFSIAAVEEWVAITIAIPPFVPKITIEKGTYTLTGNAVGLSGAHKIAIAQGSYGVTGQAVTLAGAHKIAIDRGIYALTGNAVTLTGPAAKTIVIDRGIYTLTGQAVNLLQGRKIAIDRGIYTLTGIAQALEQGRRIAIDRGIYTLAGQAVNLLQGRKIAIAQGLYVLTGQAVTLTGPQPRIAVGHGVYVLTGYDVIMQLIGVISARILMQTGVPPEFRVIIVPNESHVTIDQYHGTIEITGVGGRSE